MVEMKKNQFSIEQYATLTAAFLLVQKHAETQVIYTDLVPDLVFQYNGDFEYIDMNNDGINEFGFLKSSGIDSTITTTSVNTSWYFKRVIWVGPAMIGPAIAGISIANRPSTPTA